MSVLEYFLLLAAVALAASAQILKKHGMTSFGSEEQRAVAALRHPLVLAGMLCQITMAVLWLLVLARLDVSVAYPALSLGYVIVTLWGRWVLGEVVTFRRWLGVTAIVVGVSLVTAGA